MGIKPARRIKRHRDVVVAVEVEDDVTEQVEILTDLAVAVDVVEARQDLDDRPAFGSPHLRHQRAKAIVRAAHRYEQQAEIDEDRHRKRHVIAL